MHAHIKMNQKEEDVQESGEGLLLIPITLTPKKSLT